MVLPTPHALMEMLAWVLFAFMQTAMPLATD